MRRPHDAGAIVADAHPEGVTRARDGDGHLAAVDARGDAVTDRVVDDGLQNESRHQGCRGVGLHRAGDLQAVRKPDALDGQVLLDEPHLFPGWHLVGGAGRQQLAQQAAESVQDIHGLGIALGHDQRADGVQRVVQEMRLQLCLEGAQVGVGQLLAMGVPIAGPHGQLAERYNEEVHEQRGVEPWRRRYRRAPPDPRADR